MPSWLSGCRRGTDAGKQIHVQKNRAAGYLLRGIITVFQLSFLLGLGLGIGKPTGCGNV